MVVVINVLFDEISNIIQYLPDEIKNTEFLGEFNNNRYEQQLKQVYEELKKNKRTSNLKELNKNSIMNAK